MKSFAILILAALVVALGSMVRGKAVAMIAGPEGFSSYALFLSALGAATTILSLNMGVGIAKRLADSRSQQSKWELNLNAATSLSGLLLLGSTLISVAAATIILGVSGIDASLIYCVAFSVPLSILVNMLLSFHQGRGTTDRYARLQVVAAVVSTSLVLMFLKSEQALISLALVAYPLSFSVLYLVNPVRRRESFSFTRAAWMGRDILRRGITFTLSGVIQQSVIFGLRFSIVAILVPTESGLVLGAWAASFSLMALFSVPLGKFLLPTLRRSLNRGIDVYQERSILLLSIVLFCIGIISLFLIVFSEEIMWILYSEEFIQVHAAFQLFVLAEALRVISGFMGYCWVSRDGEEIQLRAEILAALITVSAFFSSNLLLGVDVVFCLPFSLCLGHLIAIGYLDNRQPIARSSDWLFIAMLLMGGTLGSILVRPIAGMAILVLAIAGYFACNKKRWSRATICGELS